MKHIHWIVTPSLLNITSVHTPTSVTPPRTGDDDHSDGNDEGGDASSGSYHRRSTAITSSKWRPIPEDLFTRKSPGSGDGNDDDDLLDNPFLNLLDNQFLDTGDHPSSDDDSDDEPLQQKLQRKGACPLPHHHSLFGWAGFRERST